MTMTYQYETGKGVRVKAGIVRRLVLALLKPKQTGGLSSLPCLSKCDGHSTSGSLACLTLKECGI